MSGNRARIAEVDLLRGLAAALMILGHSFIEYPVDISGIAWCAGIRHIIYTFHMELFFLLSGFVYRCGDYRSFIAKRARRLMVPFLFFGLMTALLRAYGGALINGVEPLGPALVQLVLRGRGYWFLYTMFLASAVYPLLDRITPRLWHKGVLVAALLALYELVELPGVLTINNLVYYLTFFVTGHMLARAWKGVEQSLSRRKAAALVAAVVAYALPDLAELRFGVELKALKYPRAMAVMLAAYVLVKLFLPLSQRAKPAKAVRGFLEMCSRYSLQLYLFNGYAMTALRIVICQILGIESAVVIVTGIWIGNLITVLPACKWILSRIPGVRTLCGL